MAPSVDCRSFGDPIKNLKYRSTITAFVATIAKLLELHGILQSPDSVGRFNLLDGYALCTLFISIDTSRLKKSAFASTFLVIVPVDFFRIFLFTQFAACSKQRSSSSFFIARFSVRVAGAVAQD